MYKILNLAIVFTFFACCNISYAQKWAKCRGKNIAGENIYKHYSGTLGNKKIALDLRFGFCGGSNYGGSNYYYTGKEGSILFYIGEPDSFNLNITLHAEEQLESNKLWKDNNSHWDDRNNSPKWTFKITNDRLTGTWTSADKKEKRNISLTEDYKRSVPMDLLSYDNKSSDSWLLYVKPSAAADAKDAAFIVQEQLNFLGEPGAHNNWTEFLKSLTANDLPGGNMLMPVYNDNGFLVLEMEANRDFGKEYTSRHIYLCLDVLKKRRLTLNDVIHLDNEKISQLLEVALRKKFNLEKDKKLSTVFLFERVPVTGNIMLTEQGINFCYNFDEIVIKQDNLRPAKDLIKVFLPYSQLTELIQDDFKKRIGF